MDAAAELVDVAAVALRWATLGEAADGEHLLALFGESGAGSAALGRFAVEGLGDGRGASAFGKLENFYLKYAGFVGDA